MTRIKKKIQEIFTTKYIRAIYIENNIALIIPISWYQGTRNTLSCKTCKLIRSNGYQLAKYLMIFQHGKEFASKALAWG